MLKVNDAIRSRILDGLKKYSRIVAQARQRGMSDRDTADIVRAMLGDTLGYDPFFEVTAEVSLRGSQADFAVLQGERLRYLICVKSIQVVPNATHLLRLSGTSTPAYVNWVLLTNADTWACYRLGVGTDRHPELAFRVSLLDSTPPDEKATYFCLLSKEGSEQNALDAYWEESRVLHPGRIASLLLSDDTLNLVRREIQRTTNYRIDPHTLHEILVNQVLRSEVMGYRSGREEEINARLPHCYAYVREPNKPSTWRLRYRNPDGTANPEMLMQSILELNNGTAALGIPADDVPLVLQRLRQAYLELGIPPDDFPPLLRSA
jgi:hypothetical protein